MIEVKNKLLRIISLTLYVRKFTKARDTSSIPASKSFSGVGNGNMLHYPGLDDSMGRGTCQAIVQGPAESWTRLSY